jgi:hypothetical protein
MKVYQYFYKNTGSLDFNLYLLYASKIFFVVIIKDLMDRCAKFRRKQLKKGVRASVCPVCGKRGLTMLTLRMHRQRVHNHRPCKFCMDIFENEAALAAHACPLRNIACDLCPKSFRSTTGWKLHQLKAGLWIRIDLIRIRIQHFC